MSMDCGCGGPVRTKVSGPGPAVSCRPPIGRCGHSGRLVRAVEEVRGAAAAPLSHTLTQLGGLARLFAVLATNGERQGAQPRLRDLVAALEAISIRALVQAPARCFDLVQRLRLHLDERKLDVFLDVHFGALALI